MHELTQLPPLFKKIRELRGINEAKGVVRVCIQVGPFFSMSPEVLKHHLAEAVRGSDLEDTEWVIKKTAGQELPDPADVLLESVELSE